MSEIKRKVNGTSWTFKVVDSREMKRQKVGDFAGLCVPEDRMVFIHVDNIDYETVCHELFHAYVSDLHLDDTNHVQLSDIEEIFAGLFTAKGEKIIRQAKRLVKELKQLQDGE